MEKAITVDEKLTFRIELGSVVRKITADFFDGQGFTQLAPVILGRSTDPLGPDPGSSILRTPEVEYNGARLYTMNSMILHKQVAVRQLGKIFVFSPNIRLEKPERGSTKKHLFEFTQVDFEIVNARVEDVKKLMEAYLAFLSSGLAKESELFARLGVEPFAFKPPFTSYTTHGLASTYGEDWEIPASLAHEQPFWADCHKREFYDKEDPRDEGHYLNYDLVYPLGFGEALSGAEREHEYTQILKRMGRDGLEMRVYDAYVKEARRGFVPSAGAGFGVERLVRFLSRAEHVGDVQLFRRVPGEELGI